MDEVTDEIDDRCFSRAFEDTSTAAADFIASTSG
jgi:hypothetical protein